MHIILRAPLQSETFEANWVEFNTSVGNFVIQHGHAPMLLSLAAGQPFGIELINGNMLHFMVHTSAFVEVSPERITVLLGSINPHSPGA